jgi:hypothetical protein
MVFRRGGAVLKRLFDAVVRPSQFVKIRQTTYLRSRLGIVIQFMKLCWVYVTNLLLYAVPLTFAGIGFTSGADAPPWFAGVTTTLVASPDVLWRLIVGTTQNSAFLTAATGVVLVAYHSAVLFVLRSRGFLRSFYTVVYATSAYLATIFTGVMYLSTANGVERARELVIDAQKTVFYSVIDAADADVGLPGGRPDELVFTGLSAKGELIIGLLIVAALYFIYSLYLGARINHKMSRIEGSVVIVAILLAPVAYITASILYSATLA